MNILHIMTDHQRNDSLGMIQCGKEVTPNLNRLMRDSFHFSSCYNTSPLCVPARTALATGIPPIENGVTYNDWAGESATAQKTIHKYLEQAGYEMAHIGVHHIRVLPPLEEDVDFRCWQSNGEYETWAEERGIDLTPDRRNTDAFLMTENGKDVERRYSNPRRSLFPYDESVFLDNWFADRAVDYIREDRDRPFALFLNLWAPHPPMRLPEPYYSLFPPEQIKLPDNVGIPAVGEPPKRRNGVPARLAENVGEQQWREAWSAHLGLVHLADRAIGRVIDALKEKGLWNSTAVIFTSDHGDHLGQHRMFQKMELYEQAVRVPLLLRIPEENTGLSREAVSHLDIMPTILDLISEPPERQLEGQSLLPVIRGEKTAGDRALFLQFSGISWYGNMRRGVVKGGYKYIYTPDDREELYDLSADPMELTNCAGKSEYKDKAGELRALCLNTMTRQGDWLIS